jgi:hypothetical protein
VIRRDRRTVVVEADHIEGRVMNVLHEVSPTRIDLDEFKRRYSATFTNEFLPEGTGTRCVKPLVLARMRRYVVEPLKVATEANTQ